MPAFARRVRLWIGCALLLCCAGCTRETREGQTVVFSYALWVPAATAVAGIAGVVVGVSIRRHLGRERDLRDSLPELARDSAAAVSPALHDAIRRKNEWRQAAASWCLIVAGPFAALVIAPSLYLECVRVSDSRFKVDSGLWLLPNSQTVPFADVVKLELIAEEPFRKGGTPREVLVCHRNKRPDERVPINGVLARGALARILEFARARGIPVDDNR